MLQKTAQIAIALIDSAGKQENKKTGNNHKLYMQPSCAGRWPATQLSVSRALVGRLYPFLESFSSPTTVSNHLSVLPFQSLIVAGRKDVP